MKDATDRPTSFSTEEIILDAEAEQTAEARSDDDDENMPRDRDGLLQGVDTMKNDALLTIASAIANARGWRRGVPPIANVLDLLSDKARSEVMDDARAVLIALCSAAPYTLEKVSPEILDKVVDTVLAYKPKPRRKSAGGGHR